MDRKEAEQEKIKYANLINKVIVHKTFSKKMQVIKVGVGETSPKSENFYVYCELKGDLGHVTETIDYVLTNYTRE